MATVRRIREILKGKPTLEGAGVHLHRVFGFDEVPRLDPFLLLDDFRSDVPEHYLKGFPWHPHRGIETITYVLAGEVEHGDSLGNRGTIGPGDVQWMTAGSGIIHQEMPQGDTLGRMHGFQLWANLPSREKMMAPRYRDLASAHIPQVNGPEGVSIKIICGEVDGVRGPVGDIVIEPEYLDVTLPAGAAFCHATRPGHTVFAYVIDGQGVFGEQPGEASADNRTLVVFDAGDEIRALAGDSGVRFLLIAGKPLGEPVAWQGPIVMNTQTELRVAFEEYRRGTFIKATS